MLFNSGVFATFFIVFFFVYWYVLNGNLKLQNLFLLASSYFFYAWCDWRFLFLLIGGSLFTHLMGLAIYKAPTGKIKKRLLRLGVVLVLIPLLYFKYTNFFITSLASLSGRLHLQGHFSTLNIILPVAISFYTFRMISYMMEIKRGKFEPATDWVVFFSYVSFFPSLLSGPIDRPATLIPQLEKPRTLDRAQTTDGLRQILWGLFKKVVVADNCAVFSNYCFDTPHIHGAMLIVGAFFFTIQIYADFSGYSEMAIGVARLLGLNITRNFNYPYFSQNISDYWRRWHMSLTSLLTDYIFAPLSMALRDLGDRASIIAIIVTFLVSGLWHGANWTFVLWGFLYGCYFIPLILKGKMNKRRDVAKDKLFPSFREAMNMKGTFLLVMLTSVLFRSANVREAFSYYRNIFTPDLFGTPLLYPAWQYLMAMFFIVVLFSIEWVQRDKKHGLEDLGKIWSAPTRWIFYCVTFLLIMTFTGHEQQFIYFKF